LNPTRGPCPLHFPPLRLENHPKAGARALHFPPLRLENHPKAGARALHFPPLRLENHPKAGARILHFPPPPRAHGRARWRQGVPPGRPVRASWRRSARAAARRWAGLGGENLKMRKWLETIKNGKAYRAPPASPSSFLGQRKGARFSRAAPPPAPRRSPARTCLNLRLK